jgi:putative tryptophan/tyrosine transport system substrate-binding protein
VVRRRDVLALLGGALWPLAGAAQQPDRVRHIGVLGTKAATNAAGRAAFEDAMQSLGWTKGGNLRIDYRLTEVDREQMRAAAKEMVALGPEVIQVQSTPFTDELLRLTRTIPIVFVHVTDPIGSGFVASFARPGGNVTGFTDIEQSLGGKWLQLLKETVPSVTRAALLFNPDTAPGHGNFFLDPFKAAAPVLGMTAMPAPVHSLPDIEAAIAALIPDGGLVVTPESFTGSHVPEITTFAERFRVPAVYPYRSWSAQGGFLSYGTNSVDLYRNAATYVDRILKGAKPADLPVQAPTRFELVINLKTAKALGLTVLPALLARADEVLE